LLKTPLPTIEELRASDAHVLEAAAQGAAPIVAASGLEAVADALGRPSAELRQPLAAMTGVEPDRLPQALHGVGDELAFHILTTPELRDSLVDDREEEPTAAGLALSSMEMLSTALDTSRFSDRLRRRMNL